MVFQAAKSSSKICKTCIWKVFGKSETFTNHLPGDDLGVIILSPRLLWAPLSWYHKQRWNPDTVSRQRLFRKKPENEVHSERYDAASSILRCFNCYFLLLFEKALHWTPEHLLTTTNGHRATALPVPPTFRKEIFGCCRFPSRSSLSAQPTEPPGLRGQGRTGRTGRTGRMGHGCPTSPVNITTK